MLHGKDDALHEVVVLVVFRVIASLEVVAEQAGKGLIESCAYFAPQFVDKHVGGAPRFAVDEFEQYLAASAIIPFELALKIINGKSSAANSELARDLGRAVMITLILRDVKDDAKAGRLYLPKDILKQADVTSFEPLQALEDANFAYARQLLAGEAALAFLKAERLLNKLPKKDTFALHYVKNTCFCLFEMMQKRGWEIISPKPRLNIYNRLRILLRTFFK